METLAEVSSWVFTPIVVACGVIGAIVGAGKGLVRAEGLRGRPGALPFVLAKSILRYLLYGLAVGLAIEYGD